MNCVNSGKPLARAASLLIMLCVIGAPALAQSNGSPPPLDFGLIAGATASDNVMLVPVDVERGVVEQAGAYLNFKQDSRRIRANIDLNAAYQHYVDQQFDDGVIGGVNGVLVLGLAPERIDWLFQENYGQTRLNALDALTPANWEGVNYFTTGPDLNIRLGKAYSMLLSGRYSLTEYEVSPLGGSRRSASLGFKRQFSEESSVSLNATGERVQFDALPATYDYDRRETYARIQVSRARASASIDAGYAEVSGDEISKYGMLLARIVLRRQVSVTSNLRLQLVSDISDASNAFRAAQNLSGVSLNPEISAPVAEAFKRRLAILGWDFSRNRTSLGLSAEYNIEKYVDNAVLDRSLSRLAGYISRQLTPGVRGRMDLGLTREEYRGAAVADNLQGMLALNWDATRTLSWQLQYAYSDRSGKGPFLQYTENRVSFFLTWAPLAVR